MLPGVVAERAVVGAENFLILIRGGRGDIAAQGTSITSHQKILIARVVRKLAVVATGTGDREEAQEGRLVTLGEP